MKTLNKKTDGFTIVELMIATTVFSVILLVTSAGVISIGRSYYKSLTTTRVQETARSVMDDISRSLQFSDTDTISNHLENPDSTPASIKARCFGPDRYTYVINQKVETVSAGGVDQTMHALYRDRRATAGEHESTCEPNVNFTDGSELLGENMRLLKFYVSNSDPFQVELRIAYGDTDLLELTQCNGTIVGDQCHNPSDEDIATVRCNFDVAGNQFCAMAELETTVTSRVE